NELIILLDNSFSMQAKGTNGELLRKSIQDILENIRKENDTIITKKLDCTNKEEVEKLVGIKPHGGSCLKTATAVIATLINKDEAYTPVEDGSVATHTIGLKAYDLGLGSCWVHIIGRKASETETSEEFFKKVVDIPNNLMVFSLVALGYADEEKPAYTDEDLDFSKVSYNKYKK
ncbi:MAG: hypothetical protein ACPGDB_03775, partial [Fusobacterium sp.]